MLPNFIILLAAIVVVSSGEDDCLPVRVVCRDSQPGILQTFPGTVEELDSECSKMIDYMECGIGVEEKCPSHPKAVEEARIILNTINDVCDEDGDLRSGVANNIQCLGEFFESLDTLSDCRGPPDQDRIDIYMEALKEAGEIDSEGDFSLQICLSRLDSAACVILKLEEKCGKEAMDAVTEIAIRTAPVGFNRCDESIAKHLTSIVSMRKAMEENEEIANILTRK